MTNMNDALLASTSGTDADSLALAGELDAASTSGVPSAPKPSTTDTTNPNRDPAMLMSAIGGVAGAVSQIQAGRANKEIADANRSYALATEAQDRQSGEFAAVRRSIVADQLSGRARAMQSGSGTVAGAGTNRLVLNDQRLGSNMDAYLTRLNAGRQAFGAEVRGAGFGLQGSLSQRAGETGATATVLNTGSNLWLESDPRFDPRYSKGLAVGSSGGY